MSVVLHHRQPIRNASVTVRCNYLRVYNRDLRYLPQNLLEQRGAYQPNILYTHLCIAFIFELWKQRRRPTSGIYGKRYTHSPSLNKYVSRGTKFHTTYTPDRSDSHTILLEATHRCSNCHNPVTLRHSLATSKRTASYGNGLGLYTAHGAHRIAVHTLGLANLHGYGASRLYSPQCYPMNDRPHGLVYPWNRPYLGTSAIRGLPPFPSMKDEQMQNQQSSFANCLDTYTWTCNTEYSKEYRRSIRGTP